MDEAIHAAATLCKRFEGFSAHPYLCPAGVPTIGYGATHYADGKRVRMDDPPITEGAALLMLHAMLKHDYLPGVMALCPGVTGSRLGALLDFAYNVGLGNLRASTLRRRVNAGAWEDVPFELRKWNKGGGRVLKGLVLRREAEIALCS